MKEAYTFLKNLSIKENETVIVAVSGGPDSMALLHILWQNSQNRNYKVVCTHINHNVRKESEEEKRFVENFCLEKNIKFEYRKIEAYKKNVFTEEEAREKRYAIFHEIVEKYKAKYLFTAHHGDDLIETILMRITRGSTLRGYSGFPQVQIKKKYQIIRPFITLTKEEIQNYNKEKNIPYILDASNEEDTYTRNRYRKYILPQLKKENKKVHTHFYKFSQTLREYDQFIQKYGNEKRKEMYQNHIVDLSLLKKEDKCIQKYILQSILEEEYPESCNKLTDAHIDLVEKIIKSPKPNTKASLPNGIIIRKAYDKLMIKNQEERKPYKWEIKDKVVLPNHHVLEKIKESSEIGNHICKISSKQVTLPLFVRTREREDRLSLKGTNGSKKVKDIFIEKKIDMEERKTWPIVVDANNTIIWVPGLKKSKLDNPKEEMYDIILKYY